MKKHKIGIIGMGKIAQDQHLVVIPKSSAFEIAAVVSRRGVKHPGVRTYDTPSEMYSAVPDLGAVAICTPPSAHYAIAREALNAGKHVLLEKPPTTTVMELLELQALAEWRKRVLFTSWHSQYNRAVSEARQRLAGNTVRLLTVGWKEDVRHWHPGQEWVWKTGGFGVFDPGINALSILTQIMPSSLFVQSAKLVFPANCDTPIAASITFGSPMGEPQVPILKAEFDWRQEGEQTWDISIETTGGKALKLSKGGAQLMLDGKVIVDEQPAEYEAIYEHFGELITEGRSDIDMAPLQLVADSFLVGRRVETEAFKW